MGEKRVGHAGTLDPGAAGVLVVLLGRSARLCEFLMNHSKRYRAEICFGVRTDTLDSYGTVLERKACAVSKEELQAALPAFLGEIEQIPPDYSAVKIDGRPAYQLARKGVEVKKKPRKVQIKSVDILAQTGENRFLLEVACSKGTYIRTLLEDIAKSLGQIAHTSFLMRTASGGFSIEDAYTVDEIKELAAAGDFSFVRSPESALGNCRRCAWGKNMNLLCKMGRKSPMNRRKASFGCTVGTSFTALEYARMASFGWSRRSTEAGKGKRMEILKQNQKKENTAVALGTFDGLHLGHRSVLARLKEVANAKDLSARLYFFQPAFRLFWRRSRGDFLHPRRKFGRWKNSALTCSICPRLEKKSQK